MDPRDYVITESDRVVDTDLDEEPLTLPSGAVLDERAAADLGEVVATRAARGRGRPSLSGSRTRSPQLGVRVSQDVHDRLTARAEAEGKRVSDVVREAIEHYV